VTFFARERITAALARMFEVVARDAPIDIAEVASNRFGNAFSNSVYR
jgi:hypothetical protein